MKHSNVVHRPRRPYFAPQVVVGYRARNARHLAHWAVRVVLSLVALCFVLALVGAWR